MKLTELEKKCNGAIPEPWVYDNGIVYYDQGIQPHIAELVDLDSMDSNGLLIASARNELPKLLTLIRQMKEALEFYANPESYKDQDNSCGDPECCTRFPYFPIEEDGGDNAKDALTALEQYEADND